MEHSGDDMGHGPSCPTCAAYGATDEARISIGNPAYCMRHGEDEPHSFEGSLILRDDWGAPEYTGRTVASLELSFPCGDESGIELTLGDAIALRDMLTRRIEGEYALRDGAKWPDEA